MAAGSEVAIAETGVPPAPERAAIADEADLAAIRDAARVLERSTLVGRMSSLAGRPLEMISRNLPAPAQEAVGRATELAMKAALRAALTTIPRDGRFRVRGLDRAAAVASGALGGALGLVSLPVELPVSTMLILRTIAEIARENGEDLADPATRLACLEVFALGSRTEADDLASSGYFAVRTALARSVSQAAKLAAAQGLADTSAPALVRFMAQVASRFGIVVSQKVAAGAVPILGALGGAAVNAAFLEHFRAIARAHFTIRRLERTYGEEAVKAAYAAAEAELPPAAT
ncbi:EcsC family protein [Enterovirga aerilata]|uniref:EcsC family protein n=1 Tax=Enterovirga aerilata TaxID=2730920 RepID=A0A849IGA2_9HYPH|nr:EcsC family protein [Enterovirga sp. DB1703]NNM75235.1 EcsC family protein [Enterovirga sp. DB1703]